MASKRFYNQPDTLVGEALDGLAALASVDGRDRLVRLDGYPYLKVLLRAELDPSKVALVSGGGAGHEPAHAGFVGAGMLSAAVSGEIFASPSVDAVEAGILAATGEAGCLLIVKNYTGDRLNFGLAAERVRARGLRVETVLVADDVAIPGASQARGVAGTLFVHKIAGHLAEQGATLDEVAAVARAVAGETRSLGVSLSGCSIPGQPSTERLAANEGELGLGIHGEPGLERFELSSLRAIVAVLAERLAVHLPRAAARYAALINNLGAVPSLEMAAITREILDSPLADRIELVVGPAPLMTSLDMNGFSLSLLPLDDARRAALTRPVGPIAWPLARRVQAVELRPVPARAAAAEPAPSSEPRTEARLRAILDRLLAHEAELNRLDAAIGDGDTGTTVATAARALLAELDALPLAEPDRLLAAIAERLGRTMGGSAGVLLAIFCTAAGEAAGRGQGWTEALAAGADRVAEYGGATLGDRTMLDALVPALDRLASEGIEAAASAARAGAEATAAMTRARAGRAAYLAAQTLDGVPDPGAIAVMLAFEAVRDA